MTTIKMAHWMEVRTILIRHPADFELTINISIWIRRDPLARAWVTQLGQLWTHHLVNDQGHFIESSDSDVCTRFQHHQPYCEADFLNDTVAPSVSRSVIRRPGTPARASEWQRTKARNEGWPLVKFHRDTDSGDLMISEDIWADPKTNHIVRIERTESSSMSSKPTSIIVCDRYEYGEHAPGWVFDVAKRKRVVLIETDIFPDQWATLSQDQRQTLQALIDRSDNAWKNGSFSQFASVWKFEFQQHLPSQSEWSSWFPKKPGPWREWHSEIESATLLDCVPARIGAKSLVWTSEPKRILALKTRLRVLLNDLSYWEGGACFYVRRFRGTPRIVHWDCPWQEIFGACGVKAEHETA